MLTAMLGAGTGAGPGGAVGAAGPVGPAGMMWMLWLVSWLSSMLIRVDVGWGEL